MYVIFNFGRLCRKAESFYHPNLLYISIIRMYFSPILSITFLDVLIPTPCMTN